MMTPPEGQGFDPSLLHLPVLKQCPVCSTSYTEARDIALVEETDAGEVLHITCQSCQSALLVCTIESDLGMSSVGTLTDLSLEDAKRLRGRREISDDDVLSFHQFLQESKIFSTLFR